MIRETQYFRILLQITMFQIKYLLNVFNNLTVLSAFLGFPICFGFVIPLFINIYLV